MQLQVRGLGQRYGDSEVLRNVDLDVKRGETFVVIGPTGSGKTTLLRLIGLIDKPSSGQVYFGGREVPDSEGARLDVRRRIATVFQKPAVFNASVRDNVAYGLKVRRQRGYMLQEKVQNALETVGLGGYEDRKARTLSGGEIQRVALARAMVIEPELLLLDEPTANLDPLTTANVEKLLSDVIEKLQTTVIMSTHDLFQGQRMADRMGVIMGGEMLQTGPPRELFNLPRGRKIAEFVGTENILDGVVASNEGGIVEAKIGDAIVQGVSNIDPGTSVHACIRPEEVTLTLTRDASSARNAFQGAVTGLILLGPFARMELDCGFPLVALITVRSAEEMGLKVGCRVYASFKATGVHFIPL